MAALYKFKEITRVQESKDLVDVVLSKTQRKTPTEVHPQFKITRIRSFYMRKVKFAQTTFNEKLSAILEQFPRIDDIHPFYADLCNVLYDRDHYKIALGQVNSTRGIVDHIGKDYARLLKFADTLYKCKTLKRAGLGRMCTSILKLKSSLSFLEEVRQHMSRLPAINPNTRTLLLTGYPNVGKSSFMNIVTNANVDVQPYAFTTKSLFVGHLDYNYVRWQVIDTPGILDHPLEDRNTIEMTAITALAHIKSTVLFVIDISEHCGWTIKEQVALFDSIKPLFKGKPLLVLLNKTDIRSVRDLNAADKALIESIPSSVEGSTVEVLTTSCMTKDGVDAARTKACELLLTQRVDHKVKSGKVEGIEGRIHVTKVKPRADRPPTLPPNAKSKKRAAGEEDSDDDMEGELRGEAKLQEEGGGAGVYSVDLWKSTLLKKDEWKYDVAPEIMDGKNIADFIDPDIEAKLAELEKEEELLLETALADLDDEEEMKWKDAQELLSKLQKKREQKKFESEQKKSRNGVVVPRRRQRQLSEIEEKVELAGKDSAAIRGRSSTRKRKRQDDDEADEAAARSGSRARSASKPRQTDLQGLPKEEDRTKAEKLRRKKQKMMEKNHKASESDRKIVTVRPKHLFSGKRGIGTKDWR
jgi:nucleolar GTP-binding protein